MAVRKIEKELEVANFANTENTCYKAHKERMTSAKSRQDEQFKYICQNIGLICFGVVVGVFLSMIGTLM